MIKNIFNKILNLILPQKCLKCGEAGELICEKCLSQVKRNEKKLPENTFAVFSYGDQTISEAIKLLKYRGIKVVAPTFSKYLRENLLDHIAESTMMANLGENEEVLVIPVPLYKDRLKKRGFNQSEVIAKNIIKEIGGINLRLDTKTLKRVKNTESQVSKMTRTKRLINLNNSFQINAPENVFGKIIILVDDVITTGATIAECRKTLMKAGARKVISLAVAH
jgi:ComF family protein